MSSTAAGSRMTVYFPGGKSRGFFDSIAFSAATSAIRTGSSRAASGEFAFCHPEEELPSMLTETSARVCSYQSLTPFELKMPSTISAEEKMPAAVRPMLLRDIDHGGDELGAVLRSQPRRASK